MFLFILAKLQTSQLTLANGVSKLVLINYVTELATTTSLHYL